MNAVKEQILAKQAQFQQVIAETIAPPATGSPRPNITNFGKFDKNPSWGNWHNHGDWGKKGG